MTLKTRLTMAVLGALLLAVIVLITASRISQNETEGRFEEASINGMTALWSKIVSSQLDQMQAGTVSLSRDRDTLDALGQKDAAKLGKSAVTTYNLLKAEEVLSRLQIADEGGRVLFSSPGGFSGATKKKLVAKALAERRVQRGVERDDDGKLVATVAFPLYARGKVAGVGVFMRDLTAAIEDVKRNAEVEVGILAADGQAEYVTDKELLAKLAPRIRKGEATLAATSASGKTYTVMTQPIKDSGGEPIAYLASAGDHTASYAAQRRLTLGSLAIVLVVLAAVVYGLYRYLLRLFAPLTVGIAVMDRIAKGELDNNIQVTSKDELGQLMAALKEMSDKLVAIVNDVRRCSDSVGSAAKQISSGNNDLSNRTQEQAEALEETASSMEEMTSTVKQNADNARQANQLVANARTQAQEGGEVVNKAVAAMEQINASSKKIADIIGVIDEIAFQTNLLALNAAVEAARAGEQGRGFAVVATEVRNLAQRSATAAKEIKGLIKDSVDKVKNGSELVDASGRALTEIVGSVKKVTDIVAEIAAASQEQSSGIDQVNKAVMQMDEGTQQNAALVEEAAAASKSMEEQAHNLTQVVAFFKTGESTAARPNASAPKAVPAAAPKEKGNSHEKGNGHAGPEKKPTMRVVSPARAGLHAKAAPVQLAAKKAGNGEGEWEEF